MDVSREFILDLLSRNDRAVERAIVVLFENQTADEQAVARTNHCNGRGFRKNHARRGTRYAQWVLSGRRLTGEHLENARGMARLYVRQLVEAARVKQASKVQAA